MPRRGNPGFDADVARFVVGDLRSVWTLEALLHLRDAPQDVWSAARLTHSLRASLPMIEDILRRLQALGLIVSQEHGVVYRPATPDLADLVERTHLAYRLKPFAMISLIGRGPSVLQDLADAFRLKKDD